MALDMLNGKNKLVLTSHDKYHEYAYKKIFEKVGVFYEHYSWERKFVENDELVDIRYYTEYTAYVTKDEERTIRELVRLYELPMSDVHYDLTRMVYA